jgi:hypothetical protein
MYSRFRRPDAATAPETAAREREIENETAQGAHVRRGEKAEARGQVSNAIVM